MNTQGCQQANKSEGKIFFHFSIAIAVFLVNLDIMAISVAIISIAKQFQISIDHVSWILNAYMLTYATLIVLAGHLGDLFGRRKIVIIGLIVFLFASFFCGISYNEGMLILSRAAQGIGSAFIWPNTLALAMTVPVNKKLGSIAGTLISLIGFSSAFGPVFGGLIIHFLNWHWFFFANIPLALIAISLLVFHQPSENKRKSYTLSIDYKGMFFFSAALFFLLKFIEEMHFFEAIFFAFFLIFFLKEELKTRNPMTPFNTFLSYSFSFGFLIKFFVNVALYAFIFIFSIFSQKTLNLSPLSTSLFLLGMTGMMAIIAPFSGKAIPHFGVRSLILTGCILFLIGYFGISFFIATHNVFLIFLCLFLIGTAYGVLSPPLLMMVTSALPNTKKALASGMFYIASIVGGAVGIAVASLLLKTYVTVFHLFFMCSVSSIFALIFSILLFFKKPP